MSIMSQPMKRRGGYFEIWIAPNFIDTLAKLPEECAPRGIIGYATIHVKNMIIK